MKLRREDSNFKVIKIVQRHAVHFSIASHSTFTRKIHDMGCAFRQSRKKNLLTVHEHKRRVAYARAMLKPPADY